MRYCLGTRTPIYSIKILEFSMSQISILSALCERKWPKLYRKNSRTLFLCIKTRVLEGRTFLPKALEYFKKGNTSSQQRYSASQYGFFSKFSNFHFFTNEFFIDNQLDSLTSSSKSSHQNGLFLVSMDS